MRKEGERVRSTIEAVVPAASKGASVDARRSRRLEGRRGPLLSISGKRAPFRSISAGDASYYRRQSTAAAKGLRIFRCCSNRPERRRRKAQPRVSDLPFRPDEGSPLLSIDAGRCRCRGAAPLSSPSLESEEDVGLLRRCCSKERGKLPCLCSKTSEKAGASRRTLERFRPHTNASSLNPDGRQRWPCFGLPSVLVWSAPPFRCRSRQRHAGRPQIQRWRIVLASTMINTRASFHRHGGLFGIAGLRKMV